MDIDIGTLLEFPVDYNSQSFIDKTQQSLVAGGTLVALLVAALLQDTLLVPLLLAPLVGLLALATLPAYSAYTLHLNDTRFLKREESKDVLVQL